MDPVTGFATAKAALDTLKALLGLAKEAKNPELNEKVIELQQNLLEIQEQMLRQKEENRELRARLAQAEERRGLEDQLVFKRKVYWKRVQDEEGRERSDGPYCPTCWDANKKLIRLIQGRTGVYDSGQGTRYECHVHKASFVVPQS